MAAGWTCPNGNLKKFKHCLTQYAKEVFPNGLPQKPLYADFELFSRDCNAEFVEVLEKFKPFGMKNEKPRFLIRSIFLEDFETIGKGGKHLRFEFKDGDNTLKGMWFRNGSKIKHMVKGALFDVVCEIERDEWRGAGIMLKIIDIRPSGAYIL